MHCATIWRQWFMFRRVYFSPSLNVSDYATYKSMRLGNHNRTSYSLGHVCFVYICKSKRKIIHLNYERTANETNTRNRSAPTVISSKNTYRLAVQTYWWRSMAYSHCFIQFWRYIFLSGPFSTVAFFYHLLQLFFNNIYMNRTSSIRENYHSIHMNAIR